MIGQTGRLIVSYSNMVIDSMQHSVPETIGDPRDTATEENLSEVTKEDEEKGHLLSLFHSADTMGLQQGGALSQLKQCIKTEVFGKLKFLPHEGKSLPDQARLKLTFPSFDLPDLRTRKGVAYTILKSQKMYEGNRTMADRVTYWKTYRDDIKKIIMTERSSKTQALKECVIEGKMRVCKLLFECNLITCCPTDIVFHHSI